VPPEIPAKTLLDKPAVTPKQLEMDFFNGLLAGVLAHRETPPSLNGIAANKFAG
jgi:hypothetical protein